MAMRSVSTVQWCERWSEEDGSGKCDDEIKTGECAGNLITEERLDLLRMWHKYEREGMLMALWKVFENNYSLA